jgi:hypothetical protein
MQPSTCLTAVALHVCAEAGAGPYLQVSQLLLQQLAVIQVLPDAPCYITTPSMPEAIQLQQHTTMQMSAQPAQNTRWLRLLLALPRSNVPTQHWVSRPPTCPEACCCYAAACADAPALNQGHAHKLAMCCC